MGDAADERSGAGASALERFAAGDDSAIEELLREHLPELRGYVRLRTGREIRNMESASDIVQSVCREILQHRDRFRYPGQDGFRRWLYTTALRKLSKRAERARAVKRDGRYVPLDDVPEAAAAEGLLDCYRSFCTPSQAVQAREEVERIESAFDELSDEYREVVTMARILGMSHAEIAERTGRSEGGDAHAPVPRAGEAVRGARQAAPRVAVVAGGAAALNLCPCGTRGPWRRSRGSRSGRPRRGTATSGGRSRPSRRPRCRRRRRTGATRSTPSSTRGSSSAGCRPRPRPTGARCSGASRTT